MTMMTLQQAFDLAMRHHQAGKLSQAEGLYRQILAKNPKHADALHLLGVIALQSGRNDIAGDLIRKAIALQPANPQAHYNLGNALYNKGQVEEAIAAYRRTIALKHAIPDAHLNLGYALLHKGQLDEAMKCFHTVIELKPDYAEAYYNLGLVSRDRGQLEEAIASYRTAIQLKPDFGCAHYDLALALFLTGDFTQGLSHYEWRWKCKDFPSRRRNFPQSQWDGSDLEGRTLLLHAEQGFGDVMQFFRFVPMAAQRGGKVIFECPPELKRLLQSNALGCQVLCVGEALPIFDVHCPLLSLPLAFRTTLENIPQTPYLQSDDELTKKWRERLAVDSPGLKKVGLVWAGNILPYRNRTMPLSALAPLAGSLGIRFYSLQKGQEAREARNPPAGMELTDWTQELTDFADTAALVANLDLVISIDTAAAHLAGAMGKPAWVLLPFAPDWRWMLEREDTPWYSTMRLFRQTKVDDWPDVVQRVSRALAGLA